MELNGDVSGVHHGRGEALILFSAFRDGVMKLDSVRIIVSQRDRDRGVLFAGLADRGALVLPLSSSVTD